MCVTLLAGCNEDNGLLCFPCLLFLKSGMDVAWAQCGMNKDLKHHKTRKIKGPYRISLMFGESDLIAEVKVLDKLLFYRAAVSWLVHNNSSSKSIMVQCVVAIHKLVMSQ